MSRAALVRVALLAFVACGGGRASTPSVTVPSAQPWPEADALFHRDPRWLGGDDACSVDLGDGRVLWLFGDSFIATSSANVRSQATMVRNSVAIETGYDPSHATIAFRWGASGGAPSSFFEGDGADWFWPGHGAMVEGALVVFLSRVSAQAGGLGFRANGWTAVRVDDPKGDPASWKIRRMTTPPSTLGVTFGEAVLVDAGYLFAFGAEDESHAVYLVRWPASRVASGDLSTPEWWTASGWIAQSSLTARPHALFAGGATELSVQRDPRGAGWLEVQTTGFGGATVDVRRAPDFFGPWGVAASVYTPPESSRPGVLVYAGKSHPELRGAPLIATYASDDSSTAMLLSDTTLYYPRFVRITLP